MDGSIEVRTYDQYLAEAHAELDEMLATGTPDPKPETVPPVTRGLVKVILVAVVAVVVFCIGVLLLRGRRPSRMALGGLR